MSGEIPIIDIAPLIANNSPQAQKVVANQIGVACRKNGFFYIKGHGISEKLQSDIENLSKEFFYLPLEKKMKISMNFGGRAWRGFFPVGDELTSGQPDLKEGIYFGSELDHGHPKVKAGTPLHGSNLFPDEPAELKETVLIYMDAVTQIAHAVIRGIALSLGLDEDYFSSRYTQDPFILFRIFHYPFSPTATHSDWGVGAHTDYGLITLLMQDENGGLEVKSGESWIAAPPIPNTFVCNIGDMLDRMTGGLYRSTLHRVRNTSGNDRLSFPLFFDPNFDAVVKPIAGLPKPTQAELDRWDNQDVYSFEGTYGKYLIDKVSKVFPLLTNEL